MLPSDRLFPASYKGVPFYVRKEAITAVGQKRVVHDYFNSSARYAEAQGVVPFEITMDIFFNGFGAKEAFGRFQKALEEVAPGTLVTPTFGVKRNIVAISAAAEVAMSAVGDIKMTVTFTESVERSAPIAGFMSTEKIASLVQDAKKLIASVSEKYAKAEKVLGKINSGITEAQAALFTIKAVGDAILGTGANIVGGIDNIVSFAQTFTGNLLSLPDFMRSVFDSLESPNYAEYNQLAHFGNNLPTDTKQIADGVLPESVDLDEQQASDFSIVLWVTGTKERARKNYFRQFLVNLVRLNALLGMITAASNRSYSTKDEVNQTRAAVDDAFKNIIEKDTTKIIVPDLSTSMLSLLNNFHELLDKKARDSLTTVEINLPLAYSVTLLTYKYYAMIIQNENQLDSIASLIKGLNDEQSSYCLTGPVKVLQL